MVTLSNRQIGDADEEDTDADAYAMQMLRRYRRGELK